MTKEMTAFRFSQEMIAALDELVRPERCIQMLGAENKTQWLEQIVAHFLRQSLQNKISKFQLDFCRTPVEIFRLFVMYSRAMRKVKGYGFTHKDPTKQYVYEPKEVKND